MNVRGSFVRPLQVVLLVSMASTLLVQAAAEPAGGSAPGETTEYQGPPGAAYSYSQDDLCASPELMMRLDGPNASQEYRYEGQSLDLCTDEGAMDMVPGGAHPGGIHQEDEAHASADVESQKISVSPLPESPTERREDILEEESTVQEGRRMPGFWRDTFDITGVSPSFVPREVQMILEEEEPTTATAPLGQAGEVVFAQRSSQATLQASPEAPTLPQSERASALPKGAADAGPSPATFSPAPQQVAGAGPLASLPAKQAVAGAALAFAVFALYQRFSPSTSFDHERRAAIHQALGDWPDGATSGDVARRLGMNRKTVDYHLTYLARLSKVKTAVDETGTRRYSLRALPERKPMVERVLGLVRERPGVSVLELAEALGVSRSAADRHAKALVIQGTLESRLVEGERRLFASA